MIHSFQSSHQMQISLVRDEDDMVSFSHKAIKILIHKVYNHVDQLIVWKIVTSAVFKTSPYVFHGRKMSYGFETA